MNIFFRPRIYMCLMLLSGCGYVFDPETYAFLQEPLWTTSTSEYVERSDEDLSCDDDCPSFGSDDDVPANNSDAVPSPLPSNDNNDDDDEPAGPSPPKDPGGGFLGGAADVAGAAPPRPPSDESANQ